MNRHLNLDKSVAGIVGVFSFFALSVEAAENITIHAIFLPADLGHGGKKTLAPQYEKETGVKVDVS